MESGTEISIEEARQLSRQGVWKTYPDIIDVATKKPLEKFFAKWIIHWRPGGNEYALSWPA